MTPIETGAGLLDTADPQRIIITHHRSCETQRLPSGRLLTARQQGLLLELLAACDAAEQDAVLQAVETAVEIGGPDDA